MSRHYVEDKVERTVSQQAVGTVTGTWWKFEPYQFAELNIDVTTVASGGTLKLTLETTDDDQVKIYKVAEAPLIWETCDATTAVGKVLKYRGAAKYIRFKAVCATAAVTWGANWMFKT